MKLLAKSTIKLGCRKPTNIASPLFDILLPNVLSLCSIFYSHFLQL
jgi:hypothetical protein